jgi:hypothetical protein
MAASPLGEAETEETEMTEAAKAGHNSGLDPAQERAFIREFGAVKEAEAEMAEQKGVLSGIYKRLENAGFTKEDVKWAKELQKKNVAEVLATMKRRIAIATIMGHAVGRQMEMFDKDRTPLEDAAYLEGLGAGRLRKANSNPYGMETAAGQNWQKGFNEGHAEMNAALAEAMSDNLIKAGDETSEDEEDIDSEEAETEEAEDPEDGDGDDWEAAAHESDPKPSAAPLH